MRPDTHSQHRPAARANPRHGTTRPYRRATVWLVIGLTLLILALWSLGTPAGLHGKVNAVGYAICHQIPERSFLLNGEPLPLCARCTGIYLGVMITLGVLLISGRGRASRMPPRGVLALFGLFVAVMAFDGFNSFMHLFPGYNGPYEPQNWIRLVAGSLSGMVMINLVVPVFNQMVWAQPARSPTLRSFAEFDGLVLLILLVDALVVLQHPLPLLVFGLLSAVGPVVVLMLVGGVLFISFSGRENTIYAWRGLLIPAAAGLALSFLLIGGVDALRLAVTGSWAGFDLSALPGS